MSQGLQPLGRLEEFFGEEAALRENGYQKLNRRWSTYETLEGERLLFQ